MGHIGDLMKWYENAHQKFERHGAVIIEDRTQSARGGAVTKGRQAPPRSGTAFDRIVALLHKRPTITTAEVMLRVSASRSTVQHARAVLAGKVWARPPKAMGQSIGARRRGAK